MAVAFAAHERSAFAQAYRRYASLLYSAAYNVLGNRDEAQDCVHDAIAKLWRSRAPYSAQRGSLRSFLVVCVRNEAISWLRRRAHRMRLSERLAALPREHAELGAGDPIERDRVRNAVARLPDDQRTPLAMAFYEGKTHREIAAELAQPLGTIKSRISLGLRKLGASLASSDARSGDSR
ncbi:MAG TPA: sigma-70 family RNA polymerase sigma factor [Candidatus Cybelea sp.]